MPSSPISFPPEEAEPEFQAIIADIKALEADFGVVEVRQLKVDEPLIRIHNIYIFRH
jgi:hypothetical protein